jgi:hypothetical protein
MKKGPTGIQAKEAPVFLKAEASLVIYVPIEKMAGAAGGLPRITRKVLSATSFGGKPLDQGIWQRVFIIPFLCGHLHKYRVDLESCSWNAEGALGNGRTNDLTIEPSSIVSKLITVTWKETIVARPERI